MKPIVFNKGGYITLQTYGSDGTLSEYVASTAKVQSIQAQTTQQTSQLAEGNSDWQSDYDTFKEGNIVVTMKNYDPRLHAALMGTEAVEESRELLRVQEETISSTTLILDKEPKDGCTIIGADGSEFTETEDTPSAGEYTLDGASVGWSSEDVGKEVIIKYEYTEANAVAAAFPDKGSRPLMHGIVAGETLDDSTHNTGWCNIIIDRCKAVGEISIPTLQREPQTWQFTLKVFPPRAGQKPVDFVFEPAS